MRDTRSEPKYVDLSVNKEQTSLVKEIEHEG